MELTLTLPDDDGELTIKEENGYLRVDVRIYQAQENLSFRMTLTQFQKIATIFAIEE